MRAISIYDYGLFRPTLSATASWAGATKTCWAARKSPEERVKRHSSWISLVGYCVAAVLVSSLAFATIVAGASVALADHRADASPADDARDVTPATPSPQPSGTAFTGMITDSHCGARHMRNSHQSSSECARACFRHGASYVLVDGDHRYTLVGGEADLSKLAGERANIVGTRQGEAIIVNSASAAIF